MTKPDSPTIRLMRQPDADPAVPLPIYATDGAAGADLRANLSPDERATGRTLAPGEIALIPTGITCEIPKGYEIQIRARSGLALKHGVTLANAVGTIDSDYRGPLGVILINHGREPYTIDHGERIAQAVVARVASARFSLVQALSATDRGTGGFGSTGAS